MTDLHHHGFSGQTLKDVVVYFALATTFCKKIHHTVPAATRGVSSSFKMPKDQK
jgi:hypothetical protein